MKLFSYIILSILNILNYNQVESDEISGNNDCMSDYCYQNVNIEYNKLQQLIVDTKHIVNSSQFPQFENPFRNLSVKLEAIKKQLLKNHNRVENAVDKLEEVFNQLLNSKKFTIDTLKTFREKDNNSVLYDILENIRKRFHYFEDLLVENQKTVNICDSAGETYQKFEKDVQELYDQYLEVNKDLPKIQERTQALNEEIEKDSKETSRNLSDFEKLSLYKILNNKDIDNAKNKLKVLLDDVIKNRKFLDEVLKNLLKNRNDEILSKINKTKEFLAKLQQIIAVIQSELNEYEAALNNLKGYEFIVDTKVIKLSKELEKLLQTIDKELVDYETELDKLIDEFSRSKKLWEQYLKQYIDLVENLKSSNKFLELLLSIEKNKKSIKNEIDKARKTLELLKKKAMLEKEVEKLKNIASELNTFGIEGICPPNLAVENKK